MIDFIKTKNLLFKRHHYENKQAIQRVGENVLKAGDLYSEYTKNARSSIKRQIALLKMGQDGRSQDGGGVGWGEHFLPHNFIKRAFKRRVNSTKQLLNAGRGHQAPRKATQLFERR